LAVGGPVSQPGQLSAPLPAVPAADWPGAFWPPRAAAALPPARASAPIDCAPPPPDRSSVAFAQASAAARPPPANPVCRTGNHAPARTAVDRPSPTQQALAVARPATTTTTRAGRAWC